MVGKLETSKQQVVPVIEAPNEAQLQMLVSYQIKNILKGNNIEPSYMISKARISFDLKIDNWDQLSLSGKHYLEVSKIIIFSDTDGSYISMETINDFFEDSEYFLPTLRSHDIEDWPLLLSAQIQRICELKEITPSQILSLFSILYSGHLKDEWKNFNWKDSLIPVFLMVSISERGSAYDN